MYARAWKKSSISYSFQELFPEATTKLAESISRKKNHYRVYSRAGDEYGMSEAGRI